MGQEGSWVMWVKGALSLIKLPEFIADPMTLGHYREVGKQNTLCAEKTASLAILKHQKVSNG